MIDVNRAIAEVQSKTRAEIECDTAYVWGSRAVACLNCYRNTNDMNWLFRARHYRDEALEHAAMVDDGGRTVAQLTADMAAAGWS